MAKILVVDDEHTYGVYLTLFLEDAGHDVRIAFSGHEGIELGIPYRPELLIVDWMLKNTYTGLEVSRALEADNPDLTTILITGFPSLEVKRAATAAEVFRFIEKPFEVAEILGAVEDALTSSDEFR